MLKKIIQTRNFFAKIGCFCAILLAVHFEAGAQQGNGGFAAPYLRADFIQNLSDFSSPLVNPALISGINQKHVDLAIYRYALGMQGLGYQQGSYLLPIMRNHTAGITLLYFGGTIDATGATPTAATSQQSFNDLWIIGSYAWRMSPWISLGANLKSRVEQQFDAGSKLSSPGVDVGVYFNPLDNYRDAIGNWGISFSLQDIFPTQIDWKGTSAALSTKEMTVNSARLGVRWAGFNNTLIADGELVIDNALISIFKSWKSYAAMFQSPDSAGVAQGALVSALRGGVHAKWQFIPQLWFKAGWANTNIPYLGFDWNFIYPLWPECINHGDLDLNFGYGVLDYTKNSQNDLGFTTMLKFSTDFGKTREQVLSKRMYDDLIVLPQRAYEEAMRLYYAGKYWDASFAFGKVLALFADFEYNDKIKWYMGDCYSKLQLNTIARQVFREALEEYTTSDLRPKFIYGLERLDYTEGKFDDALKNHSFVTSLYPESAIRSDADYLAGEIYFQRNDYNAAEQLLSRLKPGDSSYAYAQFTLAVINISHDKTQEAIQNLTAITKDSAVTGANQLLRDAARLKLGHLYFENTAKMKDALKQAVLSYQQVPRESPYRDEAVLGIAWSLIKGDRPAEARDAIDYLISYLPESPLVPEAYLVKGYALMLDKQYEDAVKVLEQCLTAAKKPFVTDSDLVKRKADFDIFVQKFMPTEERIKKNALRKPTNKTVEDQADMDKEFQKYAKESRDIFAYELLAKSDTRFFMRKNDVIQDAQYALAKATNMLKSQDMREQRGQQKEQEKKLEQEKQQLQEEMEKLKQGQGKGK